MGKIKLGLGKSDQLWGKSGKLEENNNNSSTTATLTSARDVAAAGAICWDGRSEEDVHNGDDSKRWPRPAPVARTDTLPPWKWPWPAPAAPGAGRGRLRRRGQNVAPAAPRTWRRQRLGGDGRTSGLAVLYACCKEEY